ncbi:hypothetical protein CLOM_g884 [Closterium sp. NIES-68]|nr:hypothetical protein CLOM_g884 [Closterium sp. NIES-68]GJP65940.1 hypothetical protein CLOP_g22833 [Closterium sp. NIES-67]
MILPRYNPPANKWHRVADLAFPRCYCMAGAVQLAGGNRGTDAAVRLPGEGRVREGADRSIEWGRERVMERQGEGEGESEVVRDGEGERERSRVKENGRVGGRGGGDSSSGGQEARGAEGGRGREWRVGEVAGEWASERLVVAGGMGASNTSLLTSVEVYNPQEDRWTSAAPLPFECDLEDAAVLANRLLLRHMRCVHSRPGPDAVAFSLTSNSWSPLSGNLPAAWHGPSTVLDDRLYMLDQIGGIRLAVYDDVAQMWRPIGRLSPALLTPPCRILGFRGRLYVIGRGLSMVVVGVEDAMRCDGVLLTRRIDGVGCPSDVVISCVVLEL